MRRDPARLVARRVLLEAERRLRPASYARERLVQIAPGLVMSVRADDQIERAIYLFGLYEFVSAHAFVRLLRPGMNVVDAGAHSGQYTLLAARRVGEEGVVVAVEPNPPVRARLERNVRLNGLRNVRIAPVALARSPGAVTLAIPGGENTGVAAVRTPSPTETAIEVEAVPLDALLQSMNVARLDVLKIDVEGMETDVLAGGRTTIARDKPAILFEANDLYFGDERTDPTVAALRDLGYRLHEPSALRIVKPGEDPRAHREYWQSLNLVALHPDRSSEFYTSVGGSGSGSREQSR